MKYSTPTDQLLKVLRSHMRVWLRETKVVMPERAMSFPKERVWPTGKIPAMLVVESLPRARMRSEG